METHARFINSNSTKENIERELLVIKARDGCREALAKLCGDVAKGVLFRARYMLGNTMNEKDAEEVAQEVLLIVCEKIGDLREPKAFMAWLNKIIINETTRYINKKIGKLTTFSYDEHDEFAVEKIVDTDIEVPEKYVENKELRDSMMAIILNMPKQQRQAILLHYYDELSVTEVARAMNIKHSSVSTYLKNGVNKIRNELKELPHVVSLGS